ncbi:MAG: hypothetical protein QGI60_05345 [archaeon]|nr:hypothetical protein [archaeon]
MFDKLLAEQDVITCGVITVLETETVGVTVPETDALIMIVIAAIVLFVTLRKH